MMRKLQFITSVFFIVLLATCTTSCLAQDVPETVKRNGDKFLVHKVEAGQTLYAISKKYFCDVEDILKANPELNVSDLKIGETILIPQDAMDRKKFRRIDITIDGNYLTHEVHRKETLYSLSKKYNIEIEQIKKYNPQIEEQGLQPGMKLKIPYAESDDAQPEVMQPPKFDSLKLHIVQKKETLYSISKQYNVSVDSIQMVNNGLPDGLKEGATIRIPRAFVKPQDLPEDSLAGDTAVAKQVNDTLNIDSLIEEREHSKTFEIALLLPFSSSLADSAEKAFDNDGKFILPAPAVTSLNFYRGIMMAADSVRKLGFSANIHLYDTECDRDSLKRAFEDSLPDFDLVFGPLFRSNFEWFADLAKEKDIPVISPVSLPTKILLERTNAVKLFPGTGSKVMQLSYNVVSNHIDSSLILWNSGRFRDRETFTMASKHANLCADQLGADSLKEMSLYTPAKSKVKALFEDSNRYTLFVPSTDQAYVSELLSSLNDLVLKKNDISFTVYGLEDWLGFDNIETEYFQTLNTRFLTADFIDYQDSKTIKFIKQYRKSYAIEPADHVFTGYDAGMYFFQGLLRYGSYLPYKLSSYTGEGLSMKFNFIKIDDYTGFENQGFYIFEYDDFQKVKLH